MFILKRITIVSFHFANSAGYWKSWKVSLLFLFLTSLLLAQGKVTFNVPTDHEKFPIIDSLYQCIVTMDKKIKKREKKIIAHVETRNSKKFIAKEKYLDNLLANSRIDTGTVLSLCKDFEAHYLTKMAYFQELLITLEGNLRARCFALFRQARSNYAAANHAFLKYSPDYIEFEGE